MTRSGSAIALTGYHEKTVKDGFAARLALFYAAVFVFTGVQLPFFPVWLEAKGLSPQEIGIVLAAPVAVRVLTAPLAARLIDRFAAPESALAAILLAAAGGYALVGIGHGFLPVLGAVALASVAFAQVMPLTDAYALRGLAWRSRGYGPVRLWGSASFIVTNMATGVLLGFVARESLIWLMVAPLAGAAAVALFLPPSRPKEPRGQEGAQPASSLWRVPTFVGVLLAASAIQASHALYYGFSALDWAGRGLSGTAVGALWALGVVSEIAMFAWSERLPAALGSIPLIVLGGSGAVVRWIVMALDPPSVLLPALQCLHALSFAATHLGAMQFLANAVPARLGATAQGDYATVQAVAMTVATALSGTLYAAYGGVAYAAMSAMAAAGVTVALIAWRVDHRAAAKP